MILLTLLKREADVQADVEQIKYSIHFYFVQFVVLWQCGVKIMLPCKKQEERAHADIRMNLRMLHTMDAENLNKKTVKMVTLVSFQQLL